LLAALLLPRCVAVAREIRVLPLHPEGTLKVVSLFSCGLVIDLVEVPAQVVPAAVVLAAVVVQTSEVRIPVKVPAFVTSSERKRGTEPRTEPLLK